MGRSHNKFLVDISVNQTNDEIIIYIPGFCEYYQYYTSIIDEYYFDKYHIFYVNIPWHKVNNKDLTNFTIIKNRILLELGKINICKPINIISHSMGNVLAIMMASDLQSNLKKFISIEGLITKNANRLTSKSLKYKNHSDYKLYVLNELKSKAFERFYNQVNNSNSKIIYNLAKDSTKKINKNYIGKLFCQLKCKKLYIYCNLGFAKSDVAFIKDNDSNCILLKLENSDHWPMLNHNNLNLKEKIKEFLSNNYFL